MTKDLSYYLSLKYPIEVLEIPEDEGGGFSASIPLLGRYTCVGDGDTISEAIDDAVRVKQRVLRDLVARGVAIPEPEVERSPEFSGRLLLRLPPELHKKVAERANARGESINRYIVNALEADARARIDDLHSMLAHLLTRFESFRLESVWRSQEPFAQVSATRMLQTYAQIPMTTVASALVRWGGQEAGQEQPWLVLDPGSSQIGPALLREMVRKGQG